MKKIALVALALTSAMLMAQTAGTVVVVTPDGSAYLAQIGSGLALTIQDGKATLSAITPATPAPTSTPKSVKDYGATGNGSTDDTTAIQNAINATPAGGTVSFPAGNYRVTRTLNFLSDRTYQGAPGAVLLGPAGYFLAVAPYNSARNMTIDGLTFDAAGISFDGSTGAADNIRITNCTFQNITNASGNWTVHNAIFLPAGMQNSTISSNRFSNILEGGKTDYVDCNANAIQGWRIRNVSITNNTFDLVNQAISLQFDGAGPYDQIVISGNQGTRVHRMGIEMQGANTQGLLVENNRFENFINPFWNTFGLSIVVDGGSNTTIRGNTLIAQPPAGSGSRYGYGIEVGGKTTLVENNSIQGYFYAGIAIGTAPNITVRNNFLCGSSSCQSIVYESSPPQGAVIQNNTKSSSCPGA